MSLVIGRLRPKIMRDRQIVIELKYKDIKEKYQAAGSLNYLSQSSKIRHIRETMNN